MGFVLFFCKCFFLKGSVFFSQTALFVFCSVFAIFFARVSLQGFFLPRCVFQIGFWSGFDWFECGVDEV